MFLISSWLILDAAMAAIIAPELAPE